MPNLKQLIGTAVLCVTLTALPAQIMAQGTNITLGGINADPRAPVEVTADSLTVDQNTKSAVFAGNVVIGQGTMRISAGQVRVIYDNGSGDIG